MIARLLISKSTETRVGEFNKILEEASLKNPHPDLLYFPSDSKLGIIEARKIKDHFSLKPYSAKGRTVILEDASFLTNDAQNALLKTLEELPEEAIIIMGAASDSSFLPTVLSRIQTTYLKDKFQELDPKLQTDIQKLLKSDVEERFEYIEKIKEKKDFLLALISFFHLHSFNGRYTNEVNQFLKELLTAEEWAKANVNIRGILEYLMLKMPVL